MSDDSKTTTSRAEWLERDGERVAGADLGLVIAWSASEPGRIGEIALHPSGTARLLGRGDAQADDPFTRLKFGRLRLGRFTRTGPLEGRRLSRRQLRLDAQGSALTVERIGRCALALDGFEVSRGTLRVGGTLLLEDELLLLCVERSREMRAVSAVADFPFGEADAHGLVGESEAAWGLRARIAFVAERAGHVLVLGETGVGKELVARAIHSLSSRAAGPFVARNAATVPHGLADAELFGHARNYPNAGVAERAGLFGEATGGTLFLDEIGELAPEIQAHLLRVLDAGGEYHRLGEPSTRRADVRLVAATNRAESALKHDFAARFLLRVDTPSLLERREDVPLLARDLLRRAARSDPKLAERFFDLPERRDALLDPHLVDRLVRHPFTTNVREAESLLWLAMAGSAGSHVALTSAVEARMASARTGEAPPREKLTKASVEAALEAAGGNQERAFRALGLPSRDALYRLIKKHGIVIRRDRDV